MQADDVAYLGNKVGIGGELERLHPVRLQAERPPNPLHGRNRKARRARHATRTPVRGTRRQALQRPHDRSLDPGIVDGPGCARSRLVSQAVYPMLGKPTPPLADRIHIHAELGRNALILLAPGAGQNNPGPQGQRLRRVTTSRYRRKLTPLPLGKQHINSATTHPRIQPPLNSGSASHPTSSRYKGELQTRDTRFAGRAAGPAPWRTQRAAGGRIIGHHRPRR